MAQFKHWIKAARPRTLPLALSTIALGSIVANHLASFSWSIFILAAITTTFLQILSNFANDYGDFEKGTDNETRIGPERALQSGAITKKAMKKAIALFIGLSLLSGIILLYIAYNRLGLQAILTLFALGIASIFAAILYTVGKKPYGYLGLGDLFVFLFFGLLGTLGTYYLHTGNLNILAFLPAISIGTFSAGVLNLNNMRDRLQDKENGKNTLAVKLGFQGAKNYHYLLIILGLISTILYAYLNQFTTTQWLFTVSFPLFILHLIKVVKIQQPIHFDPLLKQLVLSSLLFVLSFGIALLF